MAASPAKQCLDELIEKELSKETKTLAAWRLEYKEIFYVLDGFVQSPDWEKNEGQQSCEMEVQECLFRPLNELMWNQEQESLGSHAEVSQQEVSVVFGGKFSPRPGSISETLVELLASKAPKVMTVSRTAVPQESLPSNVQHIVKQNLDKETIGIDEFKDVISMANESTSKTVLYFTLGQHKGVNPFMRNIYAAENFAQALRAVASESSHSFRVVITGTDATKASTSPGSNVSIGEKTYSVPTYKISAYNFIYAMSKLFQFYIIAEAIGHVFDVDLQLSEQIQRMRNHIQDAGEDGNYHEEKGFSMEELDKISNQWGAIESRLSPHLVVAKGISICYTPLHRTPWTQQAFTKCDSESKSSPKGYVVQQVVRRFKNAISIEKAARMHLFGGNNSE